MSAVFETVIAGVSVYVTGQVIIKFLLEPVLEFKELLGEITNVFLRYQGQILSASGDKNIEDKMFIFASSLLAKRQAVTGYKHISKIIGLPSYSNVLDGAKQLNLIGNLVRIDMPDKADDQVNIYNAMQEIEKNLNIAISYNK